MWQNTFVVNCLAPVSIPWLTFQALNPYLPHNRRPSSKMLLCSYSITSRITLLLHLHWLLENKLSNRKMKCLFTVIWQRWMSNSWKSVLLGLIYETLHDICHSGLYEILTNTPLIKKTIFSKTTAQLIHKTPIVSSF